MTVLGLVFCSTFALGLIPAALFLKAVIRTFITPKN